MFKKSIFYLLILILIADFAYSFIQHLSMPLDGDMAGGIVPAVDVKQVLDDPFGITVIKDNVFYPNPNRFFAHWTFYTFYQNIPQALQFFVDPITSVYIANALVKIIIQFLFVFFLASFITGSFKICSKNFILTSIFIIPLIQTNGYRSYMGIIDPSSTYTFFYSLPLVLLLFFYIPFYNYFSLKKKFTSNFFMLALLIGLSFFLTLNGPLIPGIVLIVSVVIFIKFYSDSFTEFKISLLYYHLHKTLKAIPKPLFFILLLSSLLSIYSLYIGLNNSIFSTNSISISERYIRLPLGIFLIFTQKPGFPLLMFIIIINLYLLKRHILSEDVQKAFSFFKWIGLFSLLYVFLLPLGGYKEYRPNILRYDTFMPVTIALFYIYGKTIFLLFHNLKREFKMTYLLLIFLISIVFTFADKPEFDKNSCEIINLKKIAQSKQDIVEIESDCNIMSWVKITNPKDSELNGELLKLWHITKVKKLYYQK